MTSETARSPLDLFAVAVAFIVPIAFTPGLEGEAWSARSAILLVVIAVGLPILVYQTWGPNPLGARAAVAFVVIGAVSAALSHNRTTAVFGLYNQGTGLLFMASLAAAWAIGRSVSLGARPLLEGALIAGALVNVAVAVVAPLVTLPASLATDWYDSGGRSQALAGNPVHLAALAVLAFALIVPRLASSPARWAVTVVAIAAAVQLSGTRLALLVIVALIVWAARRHGIRIAATLAVLVVLGLAAGTVIGHTGGGSATARATSVEDWRTRPNTWLSARHSIAAHPLLGIGPGQFRTATSPYRPVSVALSEGPEKLFSDAHDLFVEYLTTTGVLGLAALAIWLVAAVRPARGWLLAGALGVLAIHLVEPQSVITTPLLFLALGAAGAPDGARPARPTIAPALTGVLVAIALVAAGFFLVGEADLNQSQLDLSAAPVTQANHILPSWPRPASLLAKVLLFDAITGHRNGPQYAESRAWRLSAVHRDGTDPALWEDLAEYDESRGRAGDANAEFLEALRLNPTSARAMDGLTRLATAGCDLKEADLWHQRSLRVAPPVAGTPSIPIALPTTCATTGTP